MLEREIINIERTIPTDRRESTSVRTHAASMPENNNAYEQCNRKIFNFIPHLVSTKGEFGKPGSPCPLILPMYR